MSETVDETTAKEPGYSLGQVNTDSLKEVLSQLAGSYPFVDETSRMAFMSQINGLHEGGNPHEADAAAAIVPAASPTETTPGVAAEVSAATTAPAASPTAETASAVVQGVKPPEVDPRDARIAELEAQLAAGRPTANEPAVATEGTQVVETPAPAPAPTDTTVTPEGQ